MILDAHDKNRVKEMFSTWMEIGEQRKQLNESSKDTTKEVADILKVKTKTVTKLFNFLKQKYDGGEDELDTLLEIATSIEG